MTSMTFFFFFIPLLASILLAVNFIFASHNPYQEKNSTFECGYHSFLGQNRTQFSVSFFIFALIFLLFDLEILLVYPYSVSGYSNDIYGLVIMLTFFLLLTLGFAFEFGKNALKIETRQMFTKMPHNKYKLSSLQSGFNFLSMFISSYKRILVHIYKFRSKIHGIVIIVILNFIFKKPFMYIIHSLELTYADFIIFIFPAYIATCL